MNAMSPFQRAVTIAFSLLLHGSIIIAGLLFAKAETLPEEKIYRVSLAEFAPAQASVTPGQEGTAASAPVESPPEMPVKPVEPEVVPPPPKLAPEVRPKPTPAKPVPQTQRRQEQTRPQETESRGTQANTPEPQPAAPPQNPEGTGSGTGRGGPRTIGGLSAYAEDAVDQRPSISRRVMPEYPDRARRMNMQGQVVVRLVVDVSGKPQQCSIHSSEPEGIFDEAALAAARKTRFLPGKVKGQPVNTIVLIPYRFALR